MNPSIRKIILAAVLGPLILCGSAFSQAPLRIVSLSPAITEMLYDLDLGDHIVGVTIYCDYPEAAKTKPKVGGFSNPSVEAIVAAKPDMVLLTSDGNPADVYKRLHQFGIRTYAFHAKRLVELPEAMRRLGAALGVEEKAAVRAREMEAKLERYVKISRASSVKPRPKALFIIHPEPLLVAGPGTVIDDTFALLGIDNIASDARSPYPKYSVEEIVRRAPDVIFIGRGPMSASLSDKLLARIQSLSPVQKGRVYYVSELLYRLTPRTLLGVEELSGCLETL